MQSEDQIRQLIRSIEPEFPALPAGLLESVAQQESSFDPDIISGKRASPAGAIGLMQFMPATAKDEGVDPLDPSSAVRGAGRYLTKLLNQTGSLSGSLSAYNWGIGNYQKWVRGEKPKMPSETQKYAPEVLARINNVLGVAGDKGPVGSTPPTPTIPAPVSAVDVGDIKQMPNGQWEPQVQVPKIDNPQLTPVKLPDVQNPTAPSIQNVPDTPTATPTPEAVTPAPSVSEAPLQIIDTPAGPMGVTPETRQERGILKSLKPSEAGLARIVPELLAIQKDIKKVKPMLPPKMDDLDKVLLDIVEAAI